jgi:hypothetical protein
MEKRQPLFSDAGKLHGPGTCAVAGLPPTAATGQESVPIASIVMHQLPKNVTNALSTSCHQLWSVWMGCFGWAVPSCTAIRDGSTSPAL